MGEVAQKSMGGSAGLLLGRRTYEDLHAYWSKQRDNPFTKVLEDSPKYVASTTLKEPPPWQNSTLLDGAAAEAVARLREEPGKDIVILGSGALVQTLMRDALIDAYTLLIHPLVLGSGQRLFRDGSDLASMRLVETTTTPKGVVVATYEPAPGPSSSA
jgi:dihydrofolate reductase